MHPSLSSKMSHAFIHFQRGFTLVEAVIVIAVTGIVAAVVAVFIRMPVQGYMDSTARAELTDTADTALRRMARDLRLALPNSIRIKENGGRTYLEYLPTKTGGRYLAEEDEPTTGTVLSFTDAAQIAFDAIGSMPVGAQSIVKGDSIVVYNLGEDMEPANAYNCAGACNRAEVAAAPAANTNNSYRITLTANPFAAQPTPMTSPGRHFQVIESSAVTYVCDPAAGTLTRYWGYGIHKDQPINAAAALLSGGQRALLASGVTACGFSYDNVAGSLAAQRSGVVGLSLSLQVPGSDSGTVRLFHQVHVSNTP